MLYTPHALTGAAIAYVFPNPFVAIPLSIVSHLFFDVIPHSNPNPIKAKGFTKYLFLTEILVGNIVLLFFARFFSGYDNSLFYLMVACGLGANLPDILTGPYALFRSNFLFSEKIAQFQGKIQNHVKGIYGYTFQIAFMVFVTLLLLRTV